MLSHAEQPLTQVDIPEPLLTYTAAHAHSIDIGQRTTREVLSHIATAGLAHLGAVHGEHGTLLEQAAVIEGLAEQSFSTAFSLWCHRMCIEYLTLAGGDFAAEILPKLIAGEYVGSSAMAPGFRHAAGLGELGLNIHRDTNGQYRLSGRIAWASNLFSDAIVFAAAHLLPESQESTSIPVIVAFEVAAPGVEIGPELDLLALRGTASTSITLHDVPLDDSQILTAAFPSFIRRVRPTLSVLQASFCLGLATASYRQARLQMTGINQQFDSELGQLGHRLAQVKQQCVELAHSIGTELPPAVHDVLTTRLEAGVLAKEITRCETMTAGSQGFVTSSDVNRRYREATFIPLQAPSEAQLRWELAQASRTS